MVHLFSSNDGKKICRQLRTPRIVTVSSEFAVTALIVAIAFGCAPFTWSEAKINGSACGATIETACEAFTIDKMADASGPIFAIRAKNNYVGSNPDYLKVTAYRNGQPFDMHVRPERDSLQDLAFTTFSGGPGTVFVGLGSTVADSFHVDITDCFSKRGTSCYGRDITIVPCKKHECGKCKERDRS
jgi:hypothetical protein